MWHVSERLGSDLKLLARYLDRLIYLDELLLGHVDFDRQSRVLPVEV